MACAGLAQCSSSWSLEGIHGQVVCPHCIGLAPLMDTPQPNRFRKSCAPPPLKRARSAEAFTLRVLNAMTAKSDGVAVRLRSQSPRRGRRPEGQPHYMLRDSEEDAKFAGKPPLLLQQLSRRWK